MTTVRITLTDEMKDFVEAQMATGGYASASDYLQTLILAAKLRQAELEREGLDVPTMEMTREDWEAIRRRAFDGHTEERSRP
jgi:antitoxin ParD1/3/4